VRTCLATVCISGSLEEKLDACAAAGLDGVEIFEQDLITSASTPEEIRARAARLGLSLDLYQPFRDLVGLPEPLFEKALGRLGAKLELMDRLGIDTLLVCSTVSPDSVDDDELVASQLRRAGELAAARGKRLAYEALAWGTHVNTYWHSWELVRAADHPAVGVCLDSFHILSKGDDPERIAQIPGEKIFFVQLADAQPLGMEVLPWSRHHRLFPGEGGFELVGFVVALLRAGYTGPLSLEIFNDVFREADPAVTVVDGQRSLRWLQQRVRGALDPSDPLREPLTALPKIEPVQAVDHVEIGTDAPDELGAQLAAVGFTLVGRHRRKDALLFRAGDTRVVITPRHGGGTGIASVAVVVADAGAASERAQALGADRAARPVTPDEAALPGVDAGRWQLFFVDAELARWTREFGDTQDSLAAGAAADAGSDAETAGDGATAVGNGLGSNAGASLVLDHLNLTEERGRFTATVLLLESVLRLVRQDPVDVPSRRGLIRSQVLQSPDAGVRWVLNQVPEALAHRSERFPVHVALSVPDAVAAARSAARAGLRPLPIPENYYEDLAARYGVDAQTLATWRELGVLYDADASGGLLHFYTRTVGGLFLEVLQRVDGYTGYGPADAPVRLAAQAIG